MPKLTKDNFNKHRCACSCKEIKKGDSEYEPNKDGVKYRCRYNIYSQNPEDSKLDHYDVNSNKFNYGVLIIEIAGTVYNPLPNEYKGENFREAWSKLISDKIKAHLEKNSEFPKTIYFGSEDGITEEALVPKPGDYYTDNLLLPGGFRQSE